MRHTDFTPFYRSAIGFDRLFQMLDSGFDSDSGYPPYNIERTAENSYRITMAVAGFTPEELNVEAKESTLTVTGEKKPDDKERTFLHRGIAARNFERRFQLADYVEVTAASFENGLLNIDLERKIPERMKPRQIAINAGEAPSQIEAVNQ
ncbi:MAG TPA: Hsp20 family protein [Hyphomicrobium sp.]|nr:Hsp20 family protein [Hyphomicrobium sp.]